MDNLSGRGDASDFPAELEGWNWGAFFLNWIWGLFNGTPIALIVFVPGAGLIMAFVLGVKGNEWAWRNQNWRSIEHFKSTQRKWAIAGIVIGCTLTFIMCIVVFASIASLPRN